MDYYLLAGEERRGPFTIDQVESMWNLGAADKNTYLWHEGLTEWILLESFITSTHNKNTQAQPPPLPVAEPVANTEKNKSEFLKKYKLSSKNGAILAIVFIIFCFSAVTRSCSNNSVTERRASSSENQQARDLEQLLTGIASQMPSQPSYQQAPQSGPREVSCIMCGGSGRVYGAAARCYTCNGSGTIRTPSGYTSVCPTCGGRGSNERCQACGGTGRQRGI